MSEIVVVVPGFLTTVQDLGRPGHAAAGVSASGAADPLALRIGNRLVGNDAAAAALEMTLTGGTFRFEADTVAALTGADPGASLDERPLATWRAFAASAGQTLSCAELSGGSRAYLCVAGGFDVPLVMGSASTQLVARLGGHQGRALIAGDRLPVSRTSSGPKCALRSSPSAIPGYRRSEPFRVTDGPQADWFALEARAGLFESSWRVADACDRMGIRLVGPPIPQDGHREIVSEGVCLGAIQIPAGGAPIVLFVDHQTTGGYPKIANVIAADLARLGGLSPRDTLRFARVGTAEARDALRAQEQAFDALFA